MAARAVLAAASGKAKRRARISFAVLCLDRATGKTLWQKVVHEEVPHEGHHRDHGFASASPVTDGNWLYAYFGSRGLYAMDFDGNVKWEKDFGDMQTRNSFGEGASPALHGDTIIVNWDHEGDDFIVALDKTTGKELWRTQRDEPTGWSTPHIVEHDGAAQVVVNGTNKVRAYALKSGDLRGKRAGRPRTRFPSGQRARPAHRDGGFRGSTVRRSARRTGGSQAATQSCGHNKGAVVPSPLLYGSTSSAATTRPLSLRREGQDATRQLNGSRMNGVYASPVSAGGRVSPATTASS